MSSLASLGLHRPELRAWALYDLANSAFVTSVITVFYPIYFAGTADPSLTAGQRTALFAQGTTVALAIVAVLSPFLGLLADRFAVRKKLLAVSLTLAVLATAGLGLVQQGSWQLSLVFFGLANIGASASFVFYDALLPHIAKPDEIDRVSSAGYAAGYLGGGVLLLFNVGMVMNPEFFGLPDPLSAMRWAFLSVAVWWAVFSIPLFLKVPEPPAVGAEDSGKGVLAGLVDTLKDLKKFDQALLLLVAFLIYNDGIGTIIRMTSAYGAEIGIDENTMVSAILVVQLIGIPCTFFFAWLSDKIGIKQAIGSTLLVYTLVTWVAYTMKTAPQFWTLALMVGFAQGGAQALSRSLFASMIPESKSSQFFAFFAVAEKFAGVIGVGLFAALASSFENGRVAVLSLVLFFMVGGFLLSKVDVAKGRRQAAEANDL